MRRTVLTMVVFVGLGVFALLGARAVPSASGQEGFSSASASGSQVFFDRVAFLAALGKNRTPEIEGFESFTHYADCSSGGPLPTTSLATALFTVTTTPTSGGTSFFCTGTAAGGPHPTEGDNALIAGSNTGSTWTLTFDLYDRAWAVAFDLTDAAEAGDAVFSTDAGYSTVAVPCCQVDGNARFFGIISDHPFTQFHLTNTGFGDGWGIDQVMLVNHRVPEKRDR